AFAGLRSEIIAGNSLSNTVEGDDTGNGFTDNDYDVTLALRTTYELAPGESDVVSTNTFFGTIAPEGLTIPELGSIRGVKYEDFNR
ncbi:MAG: hypothetical protein GTO76_02845, partial [Planctomycetales bacterium]|nr:hypothetical protein [Planctomycetales bacterium]NIO33936.1 hypothetical protein [Planctomycetales bacterium]NIP03794.1 hypothetical protein [Planctomycetales bacterium]